MTLVATVNRGSRSQTHRFEESKAISHGEDRLRLRAEARFHLLSIKTNYRRGFWVIAPQDLDLS